MLIDWFTVIAQVINFLILAWLLKRFLYRPILDAIDAREKRIADALADADAKKSAAEQQREEFQQKNTEFDQQRIANMDKVTEDVKAERARLLDSVRHEADALRDELASALKNEQRRLHDALSQRAGEEVFAIARKALRDLAETSLEERMVAIFIKRLHALNEDEKVELFSAFKRSEHPVIIHTAFVLPEEQIALIEAALKDIGGDDVDIQCVTKPDVVSGIEINMNGQKIAWSIADYLTTLTRRVSQVLQLDDNTPVSDSLNADDPDKEPEPHKKQGRHEIHV